MKLKKIIIYILLIITVLIGIFICINKFKNIKIGNNMSSQEIVDYILNIKSYKAKVAVQVKSNKNTNKYTIEQEYNGNISTQEIIEPLNICGTKITRNGDILQIENTNLSLSKIFENYKGLEENCLDLIAFIEDYKNNEKSNYKENEEEIIMRTKKTENKYLENKILYINKNTKKPIKLVVEDNNQKMTIFIQYNDVTLNFEE